MLLGPDGLINLVQPAYDWFGSGFELSILGSPYACEHGVLGEEGPPRFRGCGALGERGLYAPLESGPLQLRGLA
jgi:hypothetical protein